jgi:radical SAM protein with 4Fe4S-binding SPASM domain
MEICLTGGEPLTHPDWREILRFCCGREGAGRVRLQTNATLLTEKDAKHLAAIRNREIIVQVSLEGATAQTHDAMRGEGSFESAFRGIQRLAAVGLGPRTVAAFTETRANFSELPRLLELLADLGVGRLVTGTLVQAGRAAGNPALELPTSDQYGALLAHYHRDRAFRKRYHKMANIACLEWWFGKAASLSENCECFEMPYVTADGVLYPCLMLPADHLAVHNAHEAPFEALLEKALSLWRDLPAIRRRRTAELKPCLTCSGKSHCAGGCMGRAHGATGDFMGVEDRCALRKTVYAWEPG